MEGTQFYHFWIKVPLKSITESLTSPVYGAFISFEMFRDTTRAKETLSRFIYSRVRPNSLNKYLFLPTYGHFEKYFILFLHKSSY